MAKVTFGALLRRIRGNFGDYILRRHGKHTILARKPDLSHHKPTKAQLAQREKFQRAKLYHERVRADPEQWSVYEKVARKRRKRAYNVAIADYLNEPEIREIDAKGYAGAPGDVIVFWATDDVEVATLYTVLKDPDGVVLEEGAAAKIVESTWEYTATASVPAGTTVRIVATATDRPGGSVTKEAVVQLA